MLKIQLLLLCISALLTSCAPQDQFSVASRACEADSLAYITTGQHRVWYRKCMAQKGWTDQGQAP